MLKRFLTVVLALAVVLAMLGGCSAGNLLEQAQNYIDRLLPKDTSWHSNVRYCLHQDLVDAFYASLEESEQLSIAGEDRQEIEAASDRLEELYMDLIDQSQIAYIWYCTDLENETYSRQYLEASQICAEAEDAYMAMVKRIYLSETPAKDWLFEDWSQEELDELLLYTEEVGQLQQRNTELLVQYRGLDKDGFSEKMLPIYNEIVANNNRVAEIYGYEDYYAYASKNVYQRDYGMEQLQQLRAYTAEYLPEIYESVAERFDSGYEQLTEEQKQGLSNLLDKRYDRLPENYVQLYIDNLPQSAQEDMSGMFAQNRVAFTKNAEAYRGAFTVWIDDLPFCYYGPNYQDSETVIHELGHYYGGLYMEPWSMSVDVCETQSQGNEWLYTSFLQTKLEPALYTSLSQYKLMSELAEILGFVVLDEFEQGIYRHENAGSMTQEEFDSLLTEIAEPYGGLAYLSENTLNLQSYWKRVLPESPVYYLSYAVSSFAALDLFLIAREDTQQAYDTYCNLVEESDEDQGFLWNIRAAGLCDPFTESIFARLYASCVK